MKQLKYLEIWWVNKLDSVDFLSSMTRLNTVYMQSIKKVKSLPDLSRLKNLKNLFIVGIGTETDYSPLLDISTLENLLISNIDNETQYNTLMKVIKNNKNLKACKLWGMFIRQNKDIGLDELLSSKSISNRVDELCKINWQKIYKTSVLILPQTIQILPSLHVENL